MEQAATFGIGGRLSASLRGGALAPVASPRAHHPLCPLVARYGEQAVGLHHRVHDLWNVATVCFDLLLVVAIIAVTVTVTVVVITREVVR